tara:strand:- start:895 stop:1599 length:705 start_codon:yes stop_codon:yes gene_type:complete
MSLIGLQTYLALKIKFLISKKETFLPSFLLGIALPEIDTLIILIYNLITRNIINISILNKDITHSIITLCIIYLLFLIIYELKKNHKYIIIGKGIIFGMSTNIIIDLFLRLGDIDIFWPLPILIVKNFEYSNLTINIFLSLEFIFFRLSTHELIKQILNGSIKSYNNKLIKYLTYRMKAESIFLMIFITCCFYQPMIRLIIFLTLYSISIIMHFLSILLIEKKLAINFKEINKT